MRQVVLEVKISESSAATYISRHIGPQQHRPDAVDIGTRWRERFRREEALYRRVCDRHHATLLHGVDSGLPKLWGSDSGRCIGQNKSRKLLRRMNGQPLAYGTPERKPATRELGKIERFHQPEDIVAQLVDGLFSRRSP